MPTRTINRQRSRRPRQVRAFAFSEITPLGDSALVIRIAKESEFDPERCLPEVAAVVQCLETAGLPGLLEVAPAFTSVSMFYDPSRIAATGVPVEEVFTWVAGKIAALLAAPRARPSKPHRARAIEIPICHDPAFAPDLARVADRSGVSIEEVVATYAAARYQVACLGFMPGFPYLAGLPPSLATPRRAAPRTKIAAGSVAIGAAQTGIYPQQSPGGWNVIGRTPQRLFDVTRDPPSLLQAGDEVRFRVITSDEFRAASVAAVSDRRRVGTPQTAATEMTLLVKRAGFLTSVQDMGRVGYRASGVSPGGALDSHALKVVNHLVGNESSAAGIEMALGNVQIKFEDMRAVAWAGGEFKARIGDTEIPPGRAALIRPGEELHLIAPENGGRAWLAISGGVDAAPALKSRSTDLRGGFGGFEGRALRDGDRLVLGPLSSGTNLVQRQIGDARVASWGAAWEWVSTTPPHPFLRIVRGAHWSDFDETAETSLLNGSFAVAADSDRMGIRFEGAGISRLTSGELVSEAVAPGTIQVPPSGRPILLLGDCQTIGGYPKIAHVITVDLPLAAQLQPGALVRFAEVSLGEAHRLLVERERDLERFRIGLELQVNGAPRRRAQP